MYGTRIGSLIAGICLLSALPTAPAAPAGDASSSPEVRREYPVMGAPSNPKVDVHWNRYHDYAEITDILKRLAKAHPKLAKLQSLGKSYGGREMWVLTITNSATGADSEKPAFWIDGGIHANELQGPEVATYTAWYLLETYGRVPQSTELLDRRTFYILPMLSPDSRDAHMYRPNNRHSPRSGQRPVDDDRDGLVDEDGPDDLDGDGNITMMRVRDPAGRYKSHPDYPQIMVPAEPDEPGEYRLLGTEGFDNDDDGRVNEDGDGYYDPNRDWGWNWQPSYVQRGAYRYPFSILENRMAADFITAHPNIAGAQSYHNFGGLLLRGPGVPEETFPAADRRVYDVIAEKGEKILPGYRYIVIGRELYGVYGGEIDWLHNMRGIFTFSNELFTAYNYFRSSDDGGGPKSREETMAEFDRFLLGRAGYVAWHEVDHPQYGKVEVGGPVKSWGRQPPSFLLEEECHRNMAFTLYHAEQMPLVEIDRVDVVKLDNDLYQVTVAVANRRVTPTHAAVDVQHHITPPDRVTVSGPGLRVFSGLRADDPTFRNAKEQKNAPETMRIANIPGMEAVYVRWFLDAEGPISVQVESVKGGRDSKSDIALP